MLTLQKLQALFALADMDILGLSSEPNPYNSHGTSGERWLVKTQYGIISIHWRKRVLEIDWSGTTLRYPQRDQFGRDDIQDDKQFTYDNVTQDATSVHAWGYGKAVSYLIHLKQRILRAEYVEDYFKRRDAGLFSADELETDQYYRTNYGDLRDTAQAGNVHTFIFDK